jgi:uroporphyrinogen-III synthase
MTGAGRRVWVTRTQPGADATARRLAAMGLTPVVAPVLAARPLSGVELQLDGVAALAFTSGHAVAAFAGLCPIRVLPAFTVGAATAERARAAGFADVRSADGDVRALADLIAAAAPGRMLAPGASEPAADLAALLADRGVQAIAAPVYETAPTEDPPPLDALDTVLVHSPRAGALVAAAIAGKPQAAAIEAVAISAAAAAPLAGAGLKAVRIAERPNEAALLALLEP